MWTSGSETGNEGESEGGRRWQATAMGGLHSAPFWGGPWFGYELPVAVVILESQLVFEI